MTYKIWSAVASCLICGLGLRRNELSVGIRAKLTNLLSCYSKLIRITSYKIFLPALGAHINFDFEQISPHAISQRRMKPSETGWAAS